MSNETKWTPGPWMVGRERTPIGSAVVTDNYTPASSQEEVKYYGGNLVAESLTPANAHLIAAAPELYEALQGMIDRYAPAYHDCVDDGMPECELCIAVSALSKARGESQ